MERKEFKKVENYDLLKENCWCIVGEQILVKVKVGNSYLLGDVRKHLIDNYGNVNPSVLITGTDDRGEKIEYHEFITLVNFKDK